MSQTPTPPGKSPSDDPRPSENQTNDPAVPAEPRTVLGLSLTQVVGGSAAAATAALLGSRLGTTGTIVGAALASIVSAIAGALYTASLARTRQVVAATKELLPTTVTLRMRPGQTQEESDEAVEEAVDEAVEDAEASVPTLWQRISWKPVAIAAALVFVIGALVITGVEVVTGRSLDGSSRTTFDRVAGDGKQPSSSTDPTPTPTTPASTDGATPTPGASSSPSATPSTTPSPSASTSPTPTPSATTSPSPTASPTDGTTDQPTG